MIDVIQYKDTEYYVAFHHKTKKEDVERKAGRVPNIFIEDISFGFKEDTDKVVVSRKLIETDKKILRDEKGGKGIHLIF